MSVLVIVGSRAFRDVFRLRCVCDYLQAAVPGLDQVWSGGAAGADSLGAEWGRSRGLVIREWLPLWSAFGRSAGIVRSAQLLGHCPPGSVVACFVPALLTECRGSSFTVSEARRLGLPVFLVDAVGGRWLDQGVRLF